MKQLSNYPLVFVNLTGLVLLSLLTVASAAVNAKSEKGPAVRLDYVVAVVNEDIITRYELDEEIKTILRQIRERGTRAPEAASLEKQVLNRFILQRIQLQTAKRINIRVDDDSLNRAVENIAMQNKLDIEQFRAALQQEGVDYTKFRERIRDEMVISRLQQRHVRNRVTVSDQEIKNFLENREIQGSDLDEYRLGHILIVVPEAASAQAIQAARKEAMTVSNDLKNGADFTQLAITKSAGQQALSGGDLGWRKLAQLPIIFADQVTTMQTGDMSDLIRSPSGFHIIKLLEKRRNEPQHIVNQTKVRHILIKPNDTLSGEQAKMRIEQLKQRIGTGEDFATLALAHSDDPGSAREGGNLGWVNPGQMVKKFEKAMLALDKGQLSGAVQTRYGWHLIEVLDRRAHDNTEVFEKNKARGLIRQRKMQAAVQNWLRRIRDEAYVEIKNRDS